MMILKVWDNGGKTIDRYTVRARNDYYGMSDNAMQPNGFNQFIGSYGEIKEGKHLGKLVYENGKGDFKGLPLELRRAILDRT